MEKNRFINDNKRLGNEAYIEEIFDLCKKRLMETINIDDSMVDEIILVGEKSGSENDDKRLEACLEIAKKLVDR